ncbi:toll/interleukin-1 receptor domain-containing protein [uncultured Alistipes sp.]|uniref:toll/interleukin-1 receptor domain-containing protein n=1 Tax=uncultured Alistipes sp. TaxID=538949 RepID=UPI001434AD2E|nr:toll/interleukin-1 receptor domain-containing protein [uncultured Alistipes sp.]GFI53795.1 hypothetical protein IMSAGC022_00390 [Alistipes sp.]
MNFKRLLSQIVAVCDEMTASINRRNRGEWNCRSFCPGENRLISLLNELLLHLTLTEPECAMRIQEEIKGLNVQNPNDCVNPYAFGGIVAIMNILARKYLHAHGKKIFISHSSNDKLIIEAFVDEILQLGIGFTKDDIFCTSIENMGIRNGEDMRIHIQTNLNKCDFAFVFISENYRKSEICLNEMGAVWAKEKNLKLFAIPPVTFQRLGWLMETRQAVMIDSASGLDELYDTITQYYELDKNAAEWGRHRRNFIKSLPGKD